MFWLEAYNQNNSSSQVVSGGRNMSWKKISTETENSKRKKLSCFSQSSFSLTILDFIGPALA